MKKLTIILLILFCMGYTWKPLKKGETIEPIIHSKKCGKNVVIGVDENKNGIIDICYELKVVDGKIYKKQIEQYYDVYDGKKLVNQGCICYKR